jgi:hypothetical protein
VSKARFAPNRERIESDALLRKLMELLFVYRGMIRVTILKNIALVTYSLITLFQGARGGNGWLSKAALARCLPLGTGPKEREQRLYRFLDNIRLTPELLIPLHITLACGTKLRQRLPMILDQTTLRGIETLLIGLVFERRVLPIAFSCFMKAFIHKSQNILEHSLILAAMSCFPPEFRPLLITPVRMLPRFEQFSVSLSYKALFEPMESYKAVVFTLHHLCPETSDWVILLLQNLIFFVQQFLPDSE